MEKFFTHILRVLIALTVGLSALLVSGPVAAETLYENFTSTANGDTLSSASSWAAQTFSSSTPHYLTKVEVYLNKNTATGEGTWNIQLRSTSGGAPTSTILEASTFNIQNGVAWNTATFSGNTFIVPGTTYAIVVGHSGAGSGFALWQRSAGNGYGNGVAYNSGNGGVDWSATGNDLSFKEYGVSIHASTREATVI